MQSDKDRHLEQYDVSDEIDLREVFSKIKRHRIRLVATFVLSVALFGALFAINYLFPVESLATVRFRLDFKGAATGLYPNGMRFNTRDLMNTQVLREAYDKNALDKYLEFGDFKDSIYITRVEAEGLMQELLEYERILSGMDLGIAERERVRQQLEDLLQSTMPTEYRLNLFLRDGLPVNVGYKVLDDILAAWAVDAVERLNVLNYRVSVLSRDVFDRDLLEQEDYIIVIDILREKATRIIENARDIMRLPGGELARSPSRGLSIPEVILRVENILNYRIDPMSGLIQKYGISRNKDLMRIYIENRLLNLELDSKVLSGKAEVYNEALRDYFTDTRSMGVGSGRSGEGFHREHFQDMPPIIPQLGESFIDMVVNLAGRNLDVEYRQKLADGSIRNRIGLVEIDRQKDYYNRIIKDFGRSSPGTDSTDEEKARRILISGIDRIVEDMVLAIDDLNEIYNRISEQNLNPQKGLYSISHSPVLVQERFFGTKKAMGSGILFVGLVMFTTLVSCIVSGPAERRSG